MGGAKEIGERAELPGFVERWTDAKGVRLRYFVAGEGEPLVLVHGLSGGASNWVDVAPRLAERRRVIVPDLPGHGGSSPLPAAPSLDPFADRVHIVAERENALPAPFVGHSMGALVALRLALRHPEAVSAIVLAGAAGISSATRRAELALMLFGVLRPGRRVAPLRRAIARSALLRRAVFVRWHVSDPLSLSQQAVEGLLAPYALHSDTASAAHALVRDDPRRDLARVACPCLVLWGARDRMVPIDDAVAYARGLGAPLRTIADCGHLLIGERPDACVDAIVRFLDGIRDLDELPFEREALG